MFSISSTVIRMPTISHLRRLCGQLQQFIKVKSLSFLVVGGAGLRADKCRVPVPDEFLICGEYLMQ
jgi:hypothetical protein